MPRRRSHHAVPATARPRLLGYARNLAAALPNYVAEARVVMTWLASHDAALGLGQTRTLVAAWSDPADGDRPSFAAWRRLAVTEPLGTVGRPFRSLARTLGLDATEEAILTLAADYATHRAVMTLVDEVSGVRGGPPLLVADPVTFSLLLGRSASAIARRLAPGAPLRSSGLLEIDVPERAVSVLSRLLRVAAEPKPPSDLRAALLGPAAQPSLGLDAFAHLGEDVDHLAGLLRGAVTEGAKGVHVLLYGPPGTGKTALAATLAAEVGVPLHEVGMSDGDGGEPSRAERLGELLLAGRLLAGGDPALLLMDEGEDLFDSGFDPFRRGARAGSRAFVHRLLEAAPAPVIWTANDLSGFGGPVLRRMAACVEIRIPPARVRERLWREASDAEGVAVPAADLAGLAHHLPASPALARSAMRAARLAGGAPAAVRWAVTGVARAMAGGRLPPPDGTGEAFDPALVSADSDLAALAGRLAAPGATRRVSLLLSGPPGSGKSAFARHLAERMDLPVLQRRASDLLGPYVGQTEASIAAAFAEARDAEAFLVFDEADSLLSDRAGAHGSWEVSAVNEMLTWMEGHPLPFCCTTNLVERLDPAAMRRFLVKAHFGFLTPAQAALAWARTFPCAVIPGLAALDRLTPSDFTLVRRAAELSGILGDSGALLAALAREVSAKPGAAVPIGFRPAA